jgi:hypothetical protein
LESSGHPGSALTNTDTDEEEEGTGEPTAAEYSASQPTDSPGQGRPPGLRPGIYSRWALALVVIGFGVAIVWALRGDGQETPVLIAKSHLPAYHAIAAGDVTLSILRTGDKDRYISTPVEGRLTLREIKAGVPITTDDVGPDPTKALHSKVIVVGVNVTRAALLGGVVRTGDQIRLVPTSENKRLASLDAIVLAVTPGGSGARDWSLVVAVRSSDGRRYGSLLASTDIVVLRDPEVTAPN